VVQTGVVVIGRNEGQRLRQCLESVRGPVSGQVPLVVYVDSGSTDGSVALARSLHVHAIELDLDIPFTAARARNTGLTALLDLAPNLEFVQFVDGDCEVVASWLPLAQQHLQQHPDRVVVCGRRRERFPEASPYNRICDLEWDTPVGEAKACGGDAMMRVAALQKVGGYNPTLIAGEEPELCVRLRQNGGKIWRLDAEMTLHDAEMTRFGQWWKRMVRGGFAYAEGAALHGAPPERHWTKETNSILTWGIAIPSLSILTLGVTHGLSLILWAGYPVMTYRIYQYWAKSGLSGPDAWLYALSCMGGKFPQAQGALRFYIGKVLNRRSRLIEYNTPALKG
jgi:glycosyltransferase involved in cell wall biosynthesis